MFNEFPAPMVDMCTNEFKDLNAGDITPKEYFTNDYTGLSTTKIVTCNCHVDESAKVRYETILGIYLLTAVVLNLKFSDNVIEADDGLFKGSTPSMVDLGTY